MFNLDYLFQIVWVVCLQPRSQGFSFLNWVADPIQKGKALGTRLVCLWTSWVAECTSTINNVYITLHLHLTLKHFLLTGTSMSVLMEPCLLKNDRRLWIGLMIPMWVSYCTILHKKVVFYRRYSGVRGLFQPLLGNNALPGLYPL